VRFLAFTVKQQASPLLPITTAAQSPMLNSLQRRAYAVSSSPVAPPRSTQGSSGSSDHHQHHETDASSAIWDQYTRPMQWLHFLGAVGIVGLVISGFIAGQIPSDAAKTSKEKLKFRGNLMHLHESVGLLMLLLMLPRVGYRLVSKVGANGLWRRVAETVVSQLPRHVDVPQWQRMASNVSHALL
jgi:hypothetical protein